MARPENVRYLASVEGFLVRREISLISHLLEYQNSVGMRGAAAEIGVHHGKLSLLLGMYLKDSERLVAIDIFDAQELNIDKSGKGNLAKFKQHLNKLSLAERTVIIAGDSTKCLPSQLLSASEGRFRIFSVDGGHTYDIVSSDLALAADCMCDGGIIACDDYFNYGWPDVSFAVAGFLHRHPGRLVPFAASSNKLYLTNSEAAAAEYQRQLLRLKSPGIEKSQHLGTCKLLVFDTRDFSNARETMVASTKNVIREWVLPRRDVAQIDSDISAERDTNNHPGSMALLDRDQF